MDLIKSVHEISNEFLNLATPIQQHVKLNEAKINDLADMMEKEGKVNFYDSEDQEVEVKNESYIILRELVASSINYCYWYGNNNVRPNGANSGAMYDLVDNALSQDFLYTDLTHPIIGGLNQVQFGKCLNDLIENLSIQRYPLLEERKRHLLELDLLALPFVKHVIQNKDNPNELLEELVKSFAGFSSDIFLKRASLFFIQIYRQLGWFLEFIRYLHVPADYQVPNVLRYFEVFVYSNSLNYKIQEGKLIEKGSLMECQIRAATIITCDMLKNLLDWNIADVDTWFWTKRKLPKTNFHLTPTTDY